MCCLATVLVFLGPRAGILFWYIVDPGRWQHAFHTWLVPLAGSLFLPWTTLAYVVVAPFGNVEPGGWLLIVVGLLFDVVSYTGGGYTNRQRIPDTL